jgi:class 3 adenylate cyclase
MATLTLKALLSPKAGAAPAVASLIEAMGGGTGVEDLSGKLLLGVSGGPSQVPVILEDAILGRVTGHQSDAAAVASLVAHLAAKEIERRALAAEVLQLYREIHLIGQLSEELAAVLDITAIGKSALKQARRLIPASHAGILVVENPEGPLRSITVADTDVPPLPPDSRFAASIAERGVAEIVNDFPSDPRALGYERAMQSLICAPLRAKQHTSGVITLANTTGQHYSSAHLKLLDTIAMQTAAAVENSLASQQLLAREVERQTLKRYLPPQVADLILASGGSSLLQGVLQPITVLYADIREFTSMSEKMEARDIVQMLNEFFTAMSAVIFRCNGTLDKFIGDCIMALFGAPIASSTAASDGLWAAIGMQREMEVLNRSRSARGLPPFQIGIGLHCGLAVAGNIGSADRLQYTAIGDTVNVAARLVAKAGAKEIIVSEDVRAGIPDFAGFEPLGEVELRGRATKMNIYLAVWAPSPQ